MLPAAWVERLFARLGDALGNKLADLYAGRKRAEVEAEWAAGLVEFESEELARGIQSARLRPFAPNLGEFARLCRPALDPEYAWHEAQAGLQARDRAELGVWSHPAVFRAATAMPYEIRNSTFRATRVRWEMVLRQEFEKGWGDAVPPVPKRVEHRPTFTPMPAAVRKRWAEFVREKRL